MKLKISEEDIYHHLPSALHHFTIAQTIEIALAEDLSADGILDLTEAKLPFRDVTSVSTLDPNLLLHGRITAKERGIVAGLPIAAFIFHLVDSKIKFTPLVEDGQHVDAKTVLAEVSGAAAAMLAAERTALNFLGRMSGVATLTRKFVDAVAGTRAVILDTRKTAPSLRVIDKYAVLMGGGKNHRMGLHDMVLIKDNHIDGAGGISAAVAGVREKFGEKYPIEVEVKDLEELAEALVLKPDRIMLDNMTLEMMREAVEITAGRVKLEASGNVSLERLLAIAETGVDFISVGALTHSAPVFDVSMRVA
ncbi:MAG: carboxylating nicotinate-nucleotide diphosphorylase [Anaerolineae bacterium]|nr:carboxylating nicotinate-nucleotide diphosphorylase [Anaerolineae bacterium]